MINLIQKGNKGFYDSVAGGLPLSKPAQAAEWLNEATKKGIDTLYILTLGKRYYKVVKGGNISAISADAFKSEFESLTGSPADNGSKPDAISFADTQISNKADIANESNTLIGNASKIKQKASELAKLIESVTASEREMKLALDKVEEAVYWAESGISKVSL